MPEKYTFAARTIARNSDHGTPVSLYSNLRQIFPETLLLECLEYDSPSTARSYLCADPVLKFEIKNRRLAISLNGRRVLEQSLNSSHEMIAAFAEFQNSIEIDSVDSAANPLGLFGYSGFSAIPFFEDIDFAKLPEGDEAIPDMQYALYRYVLSFDHFYHRMTATAIDTDEESLNSLINRITFRRAHEFEFEKLGDESANMSDEDFIEIVERCRKHIYRGDVFQIVPSRKFSLSYSGDEFQVYRALRRINPSPFLFFFDYGNFSLFGSSPEAQLLIRNGEAILNPIAGTYPRGKDPAEDAEFAAKLLADPKESAEHVMLVDLARNDLSRNCKRVRVKSFKNAEFYSHVIHLVSRVAGQVKNDSSAMQILADTFPAGTLSGAPKYRAMKILNETEPTARSFYGGSVGFFGLDGDCTQAIMIRSFLARNRKLFFQAGAGIVADSVAQNELNEVTNKLGALRRAIEEAAK